MMDNKPIKKSINMLSPKSLELKSKEEDGRWEYLDKLNDAINDKEGYNIAVSGSYGTGKSSIVKSYIDKFNKKDKVLNINIGSFLKTISDSNNISNNNQNKEVNDIDNNDESFKENTKNEDDGVLSPKEELLMQKVEKTIVKQLIYTTKTSKSKLSSINRLQNKWQLKYLIYSFSITYMIICLYYFFVDKTLISKLVRDLFNFIAGIPLLSNLTIESLLPFLRTLLLLDIVCILIKFSFYLFTIFNKAKTKVKIKSYELELDNTSSSKFSFMDNLYEILYAFMNSSIEVVFFEDIDRYQRDICIKIIEDLKELNLIINSCYGMNHKRFGRKKVVFVYSFKDSVFYDYTEKNKFYDYIVSIMPISTRYNSQMHLINELNIIGINIEDINNELLNLTSLYITDLRTLKNIVNDFDLFLNVLKIDQNQLDINQLFALCVYKNYDIRGYDKLLEYDNPIDEILSNLGNVVSEEVNKDKTRINNNITVLNQKKIEKKETIFEENKINEELPQFIVIDDKEITYEQFISEEFDVNVLKSENIKIKYNNKILDFNYDKDITDFIDSIAEIDDKIKELKHQLEKLDLVFDSKNNDENLFNYSRKYIKDVQSGKKNLNTRINKDLSKSLVLYLVYYGFIRSDYIDYITSPIDSNYFSLKDSKFIFGYNHLKYNYSLSVDHPDRIIKYLGEDSYSSSYILNNDIMRYIYEKSDGKDKKIVVNQFNDMTNEKLDFLIQLNNRDTITFKKLIEDLSKNFNTIWDNYCNQIDNNKILETYNRNSIIVELAITYNGKMENLDHKARLKSLISYYADQTNVALINPSNEETSNKVINNLKRLDVHFIDISKIVNNDDKILDVIVNEDLFELNKENIMFILGREGKANEQSILNYSIMKTSKYSNKFKTSIINHIDNFSVNIYMNETIEKFIIDDSELIKDLLINTTDELLINEILKRESFEIAGYTLPIKYIRLAYEYKHILINWKTVSSYSTGFYSTDNDLFNLTIDNIDDFYNKNTSAIKDIPAKFIKRLIDALYQDKKYQITEVILKNYNCSILEKYNIYKNTHLTEIEQKIKHNLVLFSKPNYNKISGIVDRKTLYIYLKNLLGAHDIAKVIDSIDIQALIDLKESFSENEKINILNKNIKRDNDNISSNQIYDTIKSIFKTKKQYFVTYKKEYIDNIFSKVKELFSEFKHERGLIIFTLK